MIAIGATNLPDLIDRGFLRRMPEKLYVRGPGPTQCQQILADALASYTHTIDLDDDHNGPNSLTFVFDLTEQTNRYTGFDTVNCVKRARSRAIGEMIRCDCFIEVRYISARSLCWGVADASAS